MPVKKRTKYTTALIRSRLLEDIDVLLEEIGYWSCRAEFVHEACREKVRREWIWLRTRRAG